MTSTHGKLLSTEIVCGEKFNFMIVQGDTPSVYDYVYAERQSDKAVALWEPPDRCRGWYGVTSPYIETEVLIALEPLFKRLMAANSISYGFERNRFKSKHIHTIRGYYHNDK